MKKSWIIAIVVIVVLYPSGAWLMGYSIEHRVDAYAQQFNDSNPYIRMSGNRFHRGWFVSDQEFTLEPAQAAMGAKMLHVTVHSVIHHGLICGMTCIGLARVDSHLVFGPELQPYVTSVFGSADPLSVQSRLGLFGGGSTTLSSPSIKDAIVMGGHLSSEGISAKSDYSADLDSYSLQASAPRLAFQSKDGSNFQLSDIEADNHSKRALRSLYSGDSSVSIAQMEFGKGAGPRAMSASDFKLTSHNSVTDGFYSAAVKYSIASVSATPVNLSAVNLGLTIRHLDADSLERLTAALREVNRDAGVDPKDRTARMMAAAKQPAVDLLAKQPEISIDQISASTTAGNAAITGLIKFQAVVAEDFDSSAGMMAIAKKVEADMDVTIDDAFLNSIPGGSASVGRLQPFVAQGMATHDNGKFHTAIGFHGGQATFNGKPFGPPVQK